MRRDIAAVVLLAISAGLFLALTTFTSLDGALIARGLAPANLVGRIGHWVAGGVLRVLGFSAIVLPFGLAVASWKLFKDAPPRVTLLSAAAYTALTISLATLSHLVLAGHVAASFSPGGAIGASTGGAAEGLLGFWGSVLALTATTTVALIVATDLKVQRVAAALATGARSVGGFAHDQLRGAVDEHRIAISELRAEEAAERVRQAEELADSAVVEAQSEEDHAEARAVAGALALEHVRRTFDEPAWVGALGPTGLAGDDAEAEPEVVVEAPKRRRKPKAEAKGDEATEAADAAAAVEEPVPPPAIVPPPALAKPEIVVSQA
ncbi:MAG TPA: DNA translocase FtsK 4TM domain-containing protein, partial [Anaeromyxobacteraceae bacterium]|nr:DNA translocase FtsK 4TM domain-containing protein [Anaeromyxobacteraceae bacterium]